MSENRITKQELSNELSAEIKSTLEHQDESTIGAHNASNIRILSDNFSSDNVEGAMDELFTSVSNGKNRIASAITDKGVDSSGSDTFNQMANKIRQIKSINPLFKDTFLFNNKQVSLSSTSTSGSGLWYSVSNNGRWLVSAISSTRYINIYRLDSFDEYGNPLRLRSIDLGSGQNVNSPICITDNGDLVFKQSSSTTSRRGFIFYNNTTDTMSSIDSSFVSQNTWSPVGITSNGSRVFLSDDEGITRVYTRSGGGFTRVQGSFPSINNWRQHVAARGNTVVFFSDSGITSATNSSITNVSIPNSGDGGVSPGSNNIFMASRTTSNTYILHVYNLSLSAVASYPIDIQYRFRYHPRFAYSNGGKVTMIGDKDTLFEYQISNGELLGIKNTLLDSGSLPYGVDSSDVSLRACVILNNDPNDLIFLHHGSNPGMRNTNASATRGIYIE